MSTLIPITPTNPNSGASNIQDLLELLAEADKHHPRKRTSIGAAMSLKQWESYEILVKNAIEFQQNKACGSCIQNGISDCNAYGVLVPGTKHNDPTFDVFLQDVYPEGCEFEVEEDYFFQVYQAVRFVLQPSMDSEVTIMDVGEEVVN